ncbi:unnamed protein product, partial [Ectocarpus sp. 13 AM-2016]
GADNRFLVCDTPTHKKHEHNCNRRRQNYNPTKCTHQITVRTCRSRVKRSGYPSVHLCTQSTVMHRPTVSQQDNNKPTFKRRCYLFCCYSTTAAAAAPTPFPTG